MRLFRGLCVVYVLTLLISSIYASNTKLVDFSMAQPIEVQNLNVTVGEDYILPALNARSTKLDRISRTEESSLTYSMRSAFRFEDFNGYEICMWIHIDGLPSTSPGPDPFVADTHAYFINLDLLDADGNFVYRSKATRLVARGWNEIKFLLSSGPPTNEHVSAGATTRRRQTHFDLVGGSGQIVRKARIRFSPNADIGAIRLNAMQLKNIDPCQVVMVFDDAWKGFMDPVLPLLKNENIHASVAIIGSYIENATTEGMMTRADATIAYNTLGANGIPILDFVNHSYKHRQLHNASLPWPFEHLKTEIKKGMNALTNAGFTRNDGHRFLIYPGGAADAQVFAVMSDLGIVYGRSGGLESDPNGGTYALQHPYWGWGYDTAASENGINGYDPNESLAQFKDWIDEGIVSGSPRYIIWHDVTPVKMPYHNLNNWNSTEWFNGAMQYMIQQRNEGNLDFLSMPEWYKQLDNLHRMSGVAY